MKAIDVHTHGIGGYDTTTSAPADILKMAEIQGSLGVSAIVPTIYAGRIDEMRRNLAAVKAAMEAQRHTSPKGAQREPAAILGAHLEGPFLNPRRPGALDSSVFLDPGEYPFRSLLEGFEDVVRIITLSPELVGARLLITRCVDTGIRVSMGHTEASFSEAEEGFQHGARGITHLMNAMRPYHHREPGIVGFGLLSPHVYVEVIADPFHLHPKTLELIFRAKSPSMIIIVSDSVRQTGGSVPGRKAEPVTNESGVLMGGSMTVTQAVGRLADMGFDGDTLAGAVSTNPSAYLGL